MNLLAVHGLTKHYSGFDLKDITLSLQQGRIMGLIGSNGAGKTTTLKSMLNLVCPDQGRIEMFGLRFREHEERCKQDIGVVLGEIDFYKHKKIAAITQVTKCFYKNWDDNAYQKYLKIFSLDPQKRINELSAGMRVKYMLALALSHNARLLILDEPTSGLDPVSRDDLLAVFGQLVKDGSRSILFSTHITTDLEKCADDITYIKGGRMVKSAEKSEFVQGFDHLKTAGEQGSLSLEEIMIRSERSNYDI